MYEFFINFTQILLAGIVGLWSQIWDFLGGGIQASIIALFTFGLFYSFVLRPFMTSGSSLFSSGSSDSVKDKRHE